MKSTTILRESGFASGSVFSLVLIEDGLHAHYELAQLQGGAVVDMLGMWKPTPEGMVAAVNATKDAAFTARINAMPGCRNRPTKGEKVSRGRKALLF